MISNLLSVTTFSTFPSLTLPLPLEKKVSHNPPKDVTFLFIYGSNPGRLTQKFSGQFGPDTFHIGAEFSYCEARYMFK